MKPGKLTVRHRKCPFFPGKYHQNGGFSMAMLVYLSVMVSWWFGWFGILVVFWDSNRVPFS